MAEKGVKQSDEGNFVAYPTQKAMRYTPATMKRGDSTGINRPIMDGHVPQDKNPRPPKPARR